MLASRIGRLLVALLLALLFTSISLNADSKSRRPKPKDQPDNLVQIEVVTPRNSDTVGIDGFGWTIDLRLRFQTELNATGFTGPQLTGPSGHVGILPFPGLFEPGADDKLPGLIVVLSTTSTLGRNLAGLFNITAVGNVEEDEVEIWDTWLIAAPVLGVGTPATLYVAVAADHDGDGIFNDAPDLVPDADGDGDVDHKDLMAFGVASQITRVKFFIND